MLVYFIDLLVCAFMLHRNALLRDPWIRLRAIVLIILVINLFATFMLPDTVPYVAIILRPFFLVDRLREVRKIAASALRSTPRICAAFSLVILHCTLFAIVGYILFDGIEADGECNPRWFSSSGGVGYAGNLVSRVAVDPDDTDDGMMNVTDVKLCSTFNKSGCSNFFNNFTNSFYHLWILLTTANCAFTSQSQLVG